MLRVRGGKSRDYLPSVRVILQDLIEATFSQTCRLHKNRRYTSLNERPTLAVQV